MRLIRVLWPTIIICSALAALMAMLVFPGTILRPALIIWFLFICPGMALVRFLHLKELVDKLALALALSFSIDGIVAGIYLYAGHWSPAEILITLAITSIVAVVIEVTNVHVFVYKHVGLVRSLGTLLTHPVIIGTRGTTATYGDNVSEEATVRLVSLQSISKLLPDTASEAIEEKATVQMANVQSPVLTHERFERQASATVAEDIEEKPTEQLANVELSFTARARFEQQETVQMPVARSLSRTRLQVNEDLSRPQQKSPVKELHHAKESANVDIEEKETLQVASVPALSQPASDDDKTVRVSGPKWMQRQLNITNGGFPADDIENRPTSHIANVPVTKAPLEEQTVAEDSKTQRVSEKSRHTYSDARQAVARTDEPDTQILPKDAFRTNDSQPLDDKGGEKTNPLANRRSPSKKRLATKFTRIEN